MVAGSIVKINMGLYSHYGIYAGKNLFYHYGSKTGIGGKSYAVVCKVSRVVFKNGCKRDAVVKVVKAPKNKYHSQ